MHGVAKGKKKGQGPSRAGTPAQWVFSGWLAFGLLRFGDHPELLHHAHSVEVGPVFH
jgi:hypothetical protein